MSETTDQERALQPLADRATHERSPSVSAVPGGIPSAIDQHLFTNMVRSLFNIDGYLLPELTAEHQREFVRDPVRYFMSTDRVQQNAIFREIMKRQS